MPERAFTAEENREYQACYQQALQRFKFTEASPPDAIVAAVDAYVDEWQEEKRNPKPDAKKRDATHASVCMGIAWGNQVVRQFGWLWTCVVWEGKSYYAVVKPDRSLAIYPMMFVKSCLDNPNVDCTVALSYNMLAAGNIGQMQPGSYTDLMSGVHRIVPKR